MISVTIDSLLRGIGCNVIAPPPKELFPEECLIHLSQEVLKDPKVLVLVMTAFKTHKDLFHPEILLKFIKVSECETNVIGALLAKQISFHVYS